MNDHHVALVLRLALGFVWLYTGILCLAVMPAQESLALLEPVGVRGNAARVLVWLTSGFEIGLGIAVAVGIWPRALAAVQIALIVGYTAIITVFLPEFWLHPFGPVSKNVVLVAAVYCVAQLSGKGPTVSTAR